MSSLNMLLWHIGYFEFKALEKHQVQEGHSDLFFFLKSVDHDSHVQGALLDWEEKIHSYLQGQEIETERILYQQTLLK